MSKLVGSNQIASYMFKYFRSTTAEDQKAVVERQRNRCDYVFQENNIRPSGGFVR